MKVVAKDSALSGGAPSSATFAAGSATATLSLPTRDDTVVRDGGGQVSVYLLGSSANPPVYLTTPSNHAHLPDHQRRHVRRGVDATINLTVVGSATAGDDFTLEDASGSTLSSPYSVTLSAGESSTSFTIRATDDSTAETVDETVTINATLALTKASLGSRTVTIPPSDVANVPDVTISAGSSVTEGGTASFTLERTGATTAALTVDSPA